MLRRYVTVLFWIFFHWSKLVKNNLQFRTESFCELNFFVNVPTSLKQNMVIIHYLCLRVLKVFSASLLRTAMLTMARAVADVAASRQFFLKTFMASTMFSIQMQASSFSAWNKLRYIRITSKCYNGQNANLVSKLTRYFLFCPYPCTGHRKVGTVNNYQWFSFLVALNFILNCLRAKQDSILALSWKRAIKITRF